MPQGPGDGGAVAGVLLHAEHRVLPEQFGQDGPAAVLAAGVHPDHALHRTGLPADRADEPRQQPGGVVCDDHDGDDVMGLPLGPGHCAL